MARLTPGAEAANVLADCFSFPSRCLDVNEADHPVYGQE
jgi:hypothetical protein